MSGTQHGLYHQQVRLHPCDQPRSSYARGRIEFLHVCCFGQRLVEDCLLQHHKCRNSSGQLTTDTKSRFLFALMSAPARRPLSSAPSLSSNLVAHEQHDAFLTSDVFSLLRARSQCPEAQGLYKAPLVYLQCVRKSSLDDGYAARIVTGASSKNSMKIRHCVGSRVQEVCVCALLVF